MQEANRIKSYWLRMNENDNGESNGTYSLEIETDAYTIDYPELNIKFIAGHTIVFPVAAEAINKDGVVTFRMDLTDQRPTANENQNYSNGENENIQ